VLDLTEVFKSNSYIFNHINNQILNTKMQNLDDFVGVEEAIPLVIFNEEKKGK
jgi:hypothetical protein